MTMKRVAQCVLLASALLMVPLVIPFTTDAQQLPGGRDTSLEMLEQGFDLLGVDLPNALSDYWNTPEGKARYEQLVLERFDEKVEELSELGKEDWEVAIFPIEPHGFREPSSWLDEYRRIYLLFEENLKPK